MKIQKIKCSILFEILFVLITINLAVPSYAGYMYKDEDGNLVWGDSTSFGGGGLIGPQREAYINAMLEGDANLLENALNSVKSSDENVHPCDDTTGSVNTIEAEDSANESSKMEVVSQTEEEKNENLEAVNDETDSKNSPKGGDPVSLSSGFYEQTETDFSVGAVMPIVISRRYSSQNTITTDFGYGWTSSLNQRIIFGTQANSEEVVEGIQKYSEQLSNTIKKLTRVIEAAYGGGSIDNMEAVVQDKINRSEKNLSDAESLLSLAESLLSKARGHKAEARVSGLCQSTQAFCHSIQNKNHTLRSDLRRLKNDLARLESYKTKQQSIINELNEYKSLLEKTKQRRQQNSLAMFNGTPLAYEELGLNAINVIDESGYPHLMLETYEGSGIWKTPENSMYLECARSGSGGGLLLKEQSGIQKLFNENGLLIQITDRNLNTVFIIRNTDGTVKTIQSSLGQKLSVIYENGFIKKILNEHDPSMCVTYSYLGNKLSAVTDIEGDAVTMDYDSNGRIRSLNKCDGSSVKFYYGLINSRGIVLATATTNEENFNETFDYYENKTIYTDHDGNQTTYFYDERQRIIREERPDGTVIQSSYDSNGNLISQNENGNVITFRYDSRGNKIQAIYSDNSYEEWTYDTYNQITSSVDRDRVKYEYLRDQKGNLVEYRVGGRAVYSTLVDSRGLVTRQSVYGQNTVLTFYEYDAAGNLICETCDGIKKEYEYDARGRMVKSKIDGKIIAEYSYDKHKTIQISFNGLKTTYLTNGRKDLYEILNQDTVTGIIHKTRIEYDRRHLPVKIYFGDDDSEKLISSYLYTPAGKICAQISHGNESWIRVYDYQNGQIAQTRQIKTAGDLAEGLSEQDLVLLLADAGQNVFVQKFNYKIYGNNQKKISVTDANGFQNLFEYDSDGNLVKLTDANGESSGMIYSKAGRLKEEQSSHGGWYKYDYTNGMVTTAGEKNSQFIKTEYYSDGTINKTTDRYGKVKSYNYDNMGRVNSIQKENQKIWYEYDAFNRVIKEVIGPSPSESSAVYYAVYKYSADGRTVTVTEGGKYCVINQLDAFGNIVCQIDGNGNSRVYKYDCQNMLVETNDGYNNKTIYEYNALGNVSRVILPQGEETKYSYNHFGYVEKISDECGIIYSATYDKAGRLVKERNRSDSEKLYEYDNAGRVIKVFCGGDVIEAYQYGQNSRTVTVKDGNGENYVYNYDAFGRLTDETNRKGFVQKYFYDVDGKLESQVNFDGSNTVINYSQDRTVRTISYSDGSKNVFVYDAIGNIVEAWNQYGKTIYEYDRGGRLIYQKDEASGEEIYFEYDAAGNRTRLYSSNRETLYTYGKNNEVKEIFDNKQRMRVQLEYNKNGSEALRKFGNGTTEQTLYDKAGRVIVKAQKSERGELVWAEGYLYGEDGKRRATVDNAGKVTLYEYNSKGQLSQIYYPYTKEIINNLKKEAEQNGLSVIADAGENKYLPQGVKDKLVPLMNSMQYGLANSLTNMQVFVKESYDYDKNSNRISKTTGFGKITYSYDKENCLVSSGSKGQFFVNYNYDKTGNLLSEEGAARSVKYGYNAQNRLAYSEVIDKSDKTYSQTNYAYDAFGRRVLVQDAEEAALRTIYDGFTFDVIKQSPTYENGLFSDAYETGIRWNKTGVPTGERYRYLGDEDIRDENRYFFLDEGGYKTGSSRYRSERTQFTVNGTIAAQGTAEGTQYYTTDLFGSVAAVCDASGYQLGSYTYDAFGNLLQGDLSGSTDFGYLGKQQDPNTRLYNYGYRDYSPKTARFTTVDPIRDGTNWFSYVNNDPVNFVDLWGLFYYRGSGQKSSTDYKRTEVYVFRDNDGLGDSFNSTRMIFKDEVCVYVDQVGANCSEDKYEEGVCFTEPDGVYYYTSQGLYDNGDGTYDSESYYNVLRHTTYDKNIPEEIREAINNSPGDFFEHGNQRKIDKSAPYNGNEKPRGGGCTIGKDGQAHQDEFMKVLMDGVDRPEEIKKTIISKDHVQEGCNK